MIEFKNKKVIDCFDWDKLVQETYKRPYCFQQQNGCQDRGNVEITIPSRSYDEDMNDSIPEEVNGKEMGVKFQTWLSRDPNQRIPEGNEKWLVELFWKRNFYPELQAIANDLHSKGLIDAGEYTINIDW